MKFRIDEKDLKIFIAFCILLLYLCCITVLNMHSLASSGSFYGLVPFEAFSKKYIGATLFIFLLFLIGIIFSVSSYIFDREKGFGFTTKKKDKGYSRWCSEKEMKKTVKEVDPSEEKAEAGGSVVINNGKKLWVDDGEAHSLIIGATGSGKTQCVVFPAIKVLAKAGESMVLTDPKGELYETTSEMLRNYGYNVIILNFRDPQKGNAWNPMNLPYKLYKEGNSDKAVELLDDLALNILYDEKNTGDPFWEKSAADYFSGLALGLFEDATEEQVNLNSMNLMSTLGEEKHNRTNYIKEYFDMKDPAKPAYVNASGTVYAPEETKGGVLSTFKQKIKLFSSRDNLSEMLAYSDFDMKDIGRKKTAVFMIVQDEKKTLHPLATIFIKQCYETLIDVAQEAGGHLPYRTNFILDEFANMPPLKDVTTMVTAARSRHIRFDFIIQNFAQLTKVYGKEDAETIKGNCNILYLISSELQALEELSKMCGEVKSKDKEKTSSTPLVTVSDLQRMPMGQVIWLRLRMMPFKTKLAYNWKMELDGVWGKTFPKAKYPAREKLEVQLFDIREFVKAKQEEQRAQNPQGNPMNSFMGGNPFGGGAGLFGGGNPFSDNPFSPQRNPFATDTREQDILGSQINDLLKGDKGDSSKPDDDGTSFNAEELIKKIDAKIAELEKEEQEEEQNKEEEEGTEKIVEMEESSEKNNKDSSMYENGTSSDAFFDDFFSDD